MTGMVRRRAARPRVFYLLLGFALLGGSGYGAFLVFRGILGLEPEVQAALFTFLGAFAIWLLRTTYEARREERLRGYEHRRGVYLQLLSAFQDIFTQKRAHGTAQPTDDMVKKLREVSDLLYLEASDNVHRSFRQLLQLAREGASETDPDKKTALGLQTVHGLACFMLAMRKDIGFKNTAIDEQDYLRQLLKDYDRNEKLLRSLSCE
jgi:predicted lipid-binding transport protein (Tim44 family)